MALEELLLVGSDSFEMAEAVRSQRVPLRMSTAVPHFAR